MVRYQDLSCEGEKRRSEKDIRGIDHIEVSAESLESQKELRVYFLNDEMPSELVNQPDLPAQIRKLVRISRGVRIKDIEILGGYQEDSHLVVEVDKAGDFSLYTLAIDSLDLDPAYSQCDFSFKQGCPSRLDCRPGRVCPPEMRPERPIDYMAKDYASFRQALIDLIPSLVPDWKERHEADLGIALLELLAYAADHLSYYQDAVANEAYLKNARQRISVRRHARLIDYQMHDGVSARAFIHFAVNKGGILPKATPVLTQIDRLSGSATNTPGFVITPNSKKQAIDAADVVFETTEEVHLHEILNEIKIHTWGNERCCLPCGTTSVHLIGDFVEEEGQGKVDAKDKAVFRKGDFLLFEVKGQDTADEEFDPRHRQIIRLTEDPSREDDPLFTMAGEKIEPRMAGQPSLALTKVTWGQENALRYPFCISTIGENGDSIDSVSVARGNIVLADHGITIEGEDHPRPEKPSYPSQRRNHRICLKEGPLSRRIELDDTSPVSSLLDSDPRHAKPQIMRLEVPGTSGKWEARNTLMDSGSYDTHFMVETNNEGRAWIRFGDGVYGMAPPDIIPDIEPDSRISITYRVGLGRIGNVGAGSFAHIIEPENCENFPGIASLRNPLPAWGGMDPEPMEKVKQIAPAAFHAELCRAVTEEDYAKIAERHPEISKAVATFRWTGSWHTVFITVDPRGIEEVDSKLKNELKEWIASYSQAGYDIEIDGPVYVPLEIELDICVDRDHFRSNVEEAMRLALSNQINPDGSLGFFHPDKFTFGQSLYISNLYHAILAVDGVDSAMVRVFQRYGKSSKSDLKSGRITMGRLEIVRMDNDSNFPENGILKLNMLGGK